MGKSSQSSERILACRHMRDQLDRLIKHLPGARTAKDIEDVHQVRVACRRLRASLCLFEGCLGRKRVKGWVKRLRALHRSFGTSRDLDVQRAFLTEQIKGLSPGQENLGPGLRRMLLRCTQQREALQPDLVQAIDTILKKSILPEMHLEVEKVLFPYDMDQPQIQGSEMYEQAYQQISAYVGRLRDLQVVMNDPNDIQGHHRTRIAAKKLRYVMEIFNLALNGLLDPPIKTVKKLQTLLGDIHDCDVWDSEIKWFIQAEQQRTIEFFGDATEFEPILPGLDYLESERRSRRLKLYRQSCALFEQLEQKAFWQELLICLQNRAKLKESPYKAETAHEDSPQ